MDLLKHIQLMEDLYETAVTVNTETLVCSVIYLTNKPLYCTLH